MHGQHFIIRIFFVGYYNVCMYLGYVNVTLFTLSEKSHPVTTIIILYIIARCYVTMLLLRYTRYCICDTVPPCRVHVHMFTIIQFLRARANIHTVLEG